MMEEGRPGPRPEQSNPWALKSFVILMALGLMTTSVLGVVMAFRFKYSPRLIWGLLAAGALLPALLLVLRA